LGLKKETINNEETKQNKLNPNFNWSGTNGSGYIVQSDNN
jgi:hypothetical protein